MTMEIYGKPSLPQALALVALVVIFVGGVVASVAWAWRFAEGYNPASGGMTNQMMDRKSRELQAILDGLMQHDYRQVDRAAAELERISGATGWYISEASYGPDGAALREGLGALRAAVNSDDAAAAAAAASQVVNSCMHCHEQLTQAKIRGARE
jgi:hypothetical protein